MDAIDLGRAKAALAADLATVGARYRVRRLPWAEVKPRFHFGLERAPAGGEVLQLTVDGEPSMLLEPGYLADAMEELASWVNQVQDVVMETETEQWPMCPGHRHAMLPTAHENWVAWCCPETGRALTALGNLAHTPQGQ